MDLFPRKIYLDDVFDDFISSKKDQLMKCDIYEKDNEYHLEMDIPGFDKKEISIEVNDGYLKVTAEKDSSDDDENPDKKYIRHERIYGKYERSFYIGDIEEENIKASFNNGILNVTIPKKEEKQTRRYIDID